ncbi:MAG: thioesterase family protein [bacterium]
MKKRIYYHDTDSGGVVYYANYLKFLEEARTEFFETRRVPLKEYIDKGTHFVVARQEIDYKSPAVYGDVLNIDTRISEISGVRINFEYDIKNQNGKLISKAKTIVACVDDNFKPRPIPEEIRQKITK